MVKATLTLLVSKHRTQPVYELKGILNHEPTLHKPIIMWSDETVVSTMPVTSFFCDPVDKEYIVKTGDGIYQIRLGE